MQIRTGPGPVVVSVSSYVLWSVDLEGLIFIVSFIYAGFYTHSNFPSMEEGVLSLSFHGRDFMEPFHLELYIPRYPFLCNVWLSISVFVLIHNRKKGLWWCLNMALIYVYSIIPLITASFLLDQYYLVLP